MRKLLIPILVFIFAITINCAVALAETSSESPFSNDFIDLQFTVGNKNYTSKKLAKTLEVAPTVTNGTTMVPFRALFEELGYKVEWDSLTKSITATGGKTSMFLSINKKKALVNGKEYSLETPPSISNNRTLVPLRFISEHAGTKVDWDGATKTISISKLGEFNTGSVIFYDQKNKVLSKRQAFVYDGTTLKSISLTNKEVKNTFSYKDGILITLFDSTNDTYNLVTYENGNFKLLVENFEIVKTLEFNGNLLLQGYDRQRKVNDLYRFDGKSLVKIGDDFTLGKYTFYKDTLLINKYDHFRNYSIVVIDKSWGIKEFAPNIIIEDTILDEDILFITASETNSIKSPLAMYNGTNFKILHANLNADLKRFSMIKTTENGQIFDNILCVTFPLKGSTTKTEGFAALRNKGTGSEDFQYYKPWVDNKFFTDCKISPNTKSLTVLGLSKFNNEFYIAFKEGGYIIRAHTIVLDDEMLILSNNELLHYSENFLGFSTYGDHLFVHYQFNKKTEESYMLQIYYRDKNDKTISKSVYDVKKIHNVTMHMNKLFLYVSDMDRLNLDPKTRIPKERFNFILFDSEAQFDPSLNIDVRTQNLVTGLEIKNWETLSNALVISGYEADLKRNKVYIYSDGFSELLGNFQVNYWKNVDGEIFTSGIDTDTKMASFYKITSSGKELLRSNFGVSKVEKALNNYYFINSKISNPASKYNGKNILYIWNEVTNTFTDLVVDLDLSDVVHF